MKKLHGELRTIVRQKGFRYGVFENRDYKKDYRDEAGGYLCERRNLSELRTVVRKDEQEALS